MTKCPKFAEFNSEEQLRISPGWVFIEPNIVYGRQGVCRAIPSCVFGNTMKNYNGLGIRIYDSPPETRIPRNSPGFVNRVLQFFWKAAARGRKP